MLLFSRNRFPSSRTIIIAERNGIWEYNIYGMPLILRNVFLSFMHWHCKTGRRDLEIKYLWNGSAPGLVFSNSWAKTTAWANRTRNTFPTECFCFKKYNFEYTFSNSVATYKQWFPEVEQKIALFEFEESFSCLYFLHSGVTSCTLSQKHENSKQLLSCSLKLIF